MINQVYRLIAAREIRVDFVEEEIGDNIVVKPTYLSICAADQRYYTGTRGKEAMKQKLPMALIHEGVGEVLYDPKGEYNIGDTVVMIPNTPTEEDDVIRENYLPSSKFRASGYDGFMQSFVMMERGRVIKFTKMDPRIASLLELTSVVMNAVETFKRHSHERKDSIGIWGSGNLGFISALVLRDLYPEAKIYMMGINEEKLQYFPFLDGTHLVDELPADFRVDHAFECVGGGGSQSAINQIIDYINPEGSIALMGVSEQAPAINTRMVLEKGLLLLGNSRSGYMDFKNSVEFFEKNPRAEKYMETIVSEEIVVRSPKDIVTAFEKDLNNEFKTIMKWEL